MELSDKVYSEYCNNPVLAERRYQFLKSMPKALRPYDHEEALKAWEAGRQKYMLITNQDNNTGNL